MRRRQQLYVPWCWQNQHTGKETCISDCDSITKGVQPIYLERMLVLQVQGITGELRTTAGVTLGQKSILVACEEIRYTLATHRGFEDSARKCKACKPYVDFFVEQESLSSADDFLFPSFLPFFLSFSFFPLSSFFFKMSKKKKR